MFRNLNATMFRNTLQFRSYYQTPMRVLESSKISTPTKESTEKHYRFTVTDEMSIRLDKFISQTFSKAEQKFVSLTHIQKLIRQKEIAVNGKRVKDPSLRVNLN